MLNSFEDDSRISPTHSSLMMKSKGLTFVGMASTMFKNYAIYILQLIWFSLHLVAIISHVSRVIMRTLHSYIISTGLLKKYKDINLTKLQYLAIVVESQEAYDTKKIVKLLRWLSEIGVKYICLYDMDGVLKKTKNTIFEGLGGDPRLWNLEGSGEGSCMEEMGTNLEFLSFSDGKQGIAKAASYLCTNYIDSPDFAENDEKFFTEANMEKALTAVGHGGPQPNLLLVYGPVRCHLGFPAWRLKYTEIVHMGRLKNLKYGALVHAIHDFAKVEQNYGT